MINKVNKAYAQYRARAGGLADWVKLYADWDGEFNCEYIPGDGLCVVLVGAVLVAPAHEVVGHIQEHEIITLEEFTRLCI